MLLNQQKAIEAKRDRAEEKLLAGILSDDAFVRLRARFTEQLQQIQEQIAALDSQRECDTDVVRQVLQLSQNIYEAYKKAPAALKRQYLGLFWDRFLVRDRQIVEAIPTQLFRVLIEGSDRNVRLLSSASEPESVLSFSGKEVITGPNWLPSSPLLITLADSAYLATLKERMTAIAALSRQL